MPMKFIHTTICILFMFSVTELFAQKKSNAVSWSIAGELPSSNGQPASLGVAGPVTGVHDKMMFVAGGANFPDSMPWQGGKKKYYNRLYVFTKKSKHLTPIADNFTLPDKIAYSANCSTPNGVLYAGGENETGISDKAFLLKWDDATRSVVTEQLPSLPVAVTNAAATSHNNIVFIAGGESGDGVSDKCWSIDLGNSTAGWEELPSLPKPVSHAVFVAIKSAGILKLYIVGGRRKTKQGISDLYKSVFELTIGSNQWKELEPLPYPLSAGTGVATGTAGIILFGGDLGTTFSKVESYLSAISKATSETEKQDLIRQKNQLLVAHPGFSKEILLYNIVTGKTKTVGTIPYPIPVTTTAFLWDKVVMIPSGEIKAGVRTPQILMAKIRRQLK